MRDIARYLPALVLACGAALLGVTRDQQAPSPRAPLASLPANIGAFQGTDLAISPEEQEVAGMSEYMLRQYSRDSSAAFTAYVGYYAYQLQGRTIHSPRNCLPGAGWQALGTGVTPVTAAGTSHTVNRYVITDGNQRALVYYWYQGRGRIAANEYRVKWDLLRDAALYGRSEEALVRIVVPIAAGDGSPAASADALAAADRMATNAAAGLIPLVDEVLPRWEFGGKTLVASRLVSADAR